jgi:hypothetical protein
MSGGYRFEPYETTSILQEAASICDSLKYIDDVFKVVKLYQFLSPGCSSTSSGDCGGSSLKSYSVLNG